MTIDLTTFAPQKILVCQLKQIGDVVISTAMVELLVARYPDADIQFLTEAKCAPILENNPHLSNIWTVKNGGAFHGLKTFLAIRRQRFDLVIDFQQLPRSRRTAMFSRAPVRLTYDTKWYKRLGYTHFAAMHKGGYAGKFKAQLLAPLGIEWNMQPPRMYLTDVEMAWAENYLRSQGMTEKDILVTLDPTHWSPTRRWFAESYADFIKLALQSRPNLRFYLFHGPGEKDQVEEVIRLSGREDRCMLPPDTPPSLRQTAAVIGHATIQVGNCSAPRHMAVALDTPTLTPVGSNGHTAWTFPSTQHQSIFMQVDCQKCNKEECPTGTLKCLRNITPELVTKKLIEMIEM